MLKIPLHRKYLRSKSAMKGTLNMLIAPAKSHIEIVLPKISPAKCSLMRGMTAGRKMPEENPITNTTI